MRQPDINVRLEANGDYWRAVYVDPGTGKRTKKGLGHKGKVSKSAALKKCRALAADLARTPAAALATGRAPTLSKWQEEYERLRIDVTEGTLALHVTTFKYLIEAFGDVRLDKIRPAQALGFPAWLAANKHQTTNPKKGIRPATVAMHVRQAKTIFQWGIKYGALTANPFAGVTVKVPEPEVIVPDLTYADVLTLIETGPDERWRALIALMALGGMRRGEARALEWNDIEWDRNRIHIRAEIAKGGRERYTLMEEELERVLLRAMDETNDRRFVAHVPWNNLHRQMTKIIRRAGFRPWPKPFHGLRKWRAETWIVEYPEAVVDAWVGHSMIVARKHYRKVPAQFYERKKTEPQTSPNAAVS